VHREGRKNSGEKVKENDEHVRRNAVHLLNVDPREIDLERGKKKKKICAKRGGSKNSRQA